MVQNHIFGNFSCTHQYLFIFNMSGVIHVEKIVKFVFTTAKFLSLYIVLTVYTLTVINYNTDSMLYTYLYNLFRIYQSQSKKYYIEFQNNVIQIYVTICDLITGGAKFYANCWFANRFQAWYKGFFYFEPSDHQLKIYPGQNEVIYKKYKKSYAFEKIKNTFV